MPDQYVVRRPDQLEALASTVRTAIVGCLSSRGPSSARELGESLGRDPTSLHYHLRILRRCGLVTVEEKRPTGARMESVYGLVAPVLRVDRAMAKPRDRAAMCKAVRSGLRLAEREYAAGLADAERRSGRKRDTLLFVQQQVRLRPAALRRVTRLIEDLRREARDEHTPEAGAWITLTLTVTPTRT